MQIHEKSACQIAEQIASGALRAEDVTCHYLERIARLDEALGAYLTVDADGALQQARRVDLRRRQGQPLGRLAGVPLALKDIVVTRGLRTTCGSRALEHWVPPYDATCVTRLRQADAVILGKLNMDEFAMGSSNENSAFGRCHNPWHADRVPGGSSGGSASAVAAGLCAIALGTDTGGSIRQPAALCGVVGLKPTYGRVSRYGLVAFASSLDQVGPLARSVEDTALALEAIAGHDPADSTSLAAEVAPYRQSCPGVASGQTIGVPRALCAEVLDSEVSSAFDAALSELERLGARVVDIELPHSQHAMATYYLICGAEASSNLARYDGVRYGMRRGEEQGLTQMYKQTRHTGLGTEVKRRVLLGTFALSAGYYDAYYGKAQRARTLIRRDFERAFERCDAVATPTTPAPAFAFGEKVDPLEMYLADVFTTACNLAGLPGISVPCGLSQQGLPIGLQLIGPHLAEAALFGVASAYEAATKWHTHLSPPMRECAAP